MPSSIEKLLKYFKLERERGFDNRAVVGGLEKTIPSWESEARLNQLDDALIIKIVELLTAYPTIDPAQRAEVVGLLTSELTGDLPSKTSQSTHTPSHGNNQSEVRDEVPQTPPTSQYQPESIEPELPTSLPQRGPSRSLAALNSPLTVINGIGQKHSGTLSRLGLNTLGDLLYYFPRRYDDYSRLKPINRLEYGEEVTVVGTIQAIQTRPVRGGASQLTEAVLTDGTGQLRLSWFNRPWLTNQFHSGSQVVISGKLDMYLGRLVMNSPEIEDIEKEHLHTNRIVPVYPLTSTITQKFLRRTMYQTVTFWAPRLPDFLPSQVRGSLKLVDLGVAILQAHFPDSQDALDLARWRLAFDEIFLLQLGVLRQKRAWQSAEARKFDISDEWLQTSINLLPFPLTHAQQNAINQIRCDLGTGRPMDRLLQGDVGSGKTVVAALAIAMVTSMQGQAAIMAPTSILAEQHYHSLTRLLASAPAEGEAHLQENQIRLLVGDTKEDEKEEIRAALADGTIKLIIGTHALIEDPVVFQDLELVIIDEQHRFGVAQRAALRSKGPSPHLLVMTATPIPRSLALTVYGDLDLLVMDEMPPGRQPVETHVIHPLERERAYHLIQSQIEQGHQAFIIYPLVEQGEKEEALAAVESHAKLQKEIFPKLKTRPAAWQNAAGRKRQRHGPLPRSRIRYSCVDFGG